MASKGEEFEVVGYGKKTAIEIAPIASQETLTRGGKLADNSVVLYVLKSDMQGITEATKMIVRGRRVRVDLMEDCGDNKVKLIAGPAGAKW
jgi:phosphate starvation-inducible protein PhoH